MDSVASRVYEAVAHVSLRFTLRDQFQLATYFYFFFPNSIEFNCWHVTSYLLLDVSHFFLVRLWCTVHVENVCVTQIEPEIVQKWHRQQEETHDNPSIVYQQDFHEGLSFEINYFLSAVHVFVPKVWINRSQNKLKWEIRILARELLSSVYTIRLSRRCCQTMN